MQYEEHRYPNRKHQQSTPYHDPSSQDTGLWVSATAAKWALAADLFAAYLTTVEQLIFHFINLP